MKQKEIALDLNLKAIEYLVFKVKKQHSDQDLNLLMQAVAVQPRAGTPKRAPPGSFLSHTVRAGVQEYEVQPMQQAANQAMQDRVALGQISPNRPLGDQQIYHILQDTAHCEQDPQKHMPITRKRRSTEISSQGQLDDRRDYLGELEQVDQQGGLIICTDEKPYYHGGTANCRASAPQGVPSYGYRNSRKFKIEQWAAAYGDDCSIQRPCLHWDTKALELTLQYAQDLRAANKKAKAYTRYLQEQCHVPGTPENQVYIDAMQQWSVKQAWQQANQRQLAPPPTLKDPQQEFSAGIQVE